MLARLLARQRGSVVRRREIGGENCKGFQISSTTLGAVVRSQVRVQLQLQLQLPSTQKSAQCDKTTGWSPHTRLRRAGDGECLAWVGEQGL